MKPLLSDTDAAIPKEAKRTDLLEGAYKELFFIRHPEIQKTDPSVPEKLRKFLSETEQKGVWAYYPWRNLALRIPVEEIYTAIRSARNRNLITEGEQSAFRASVVGIAGLSVGSTTLTALVATGGPKHIKIADPDTLEISNLNRIRATLSDVGQNKSEIAAKNAWDVDPFLDLTIYSSGVTHDNQDDFFAGEPALNVFVDEMDNIAMKIRSRMVCRTHRIPVVMATDNGDGVIVDVERFDEEPDRELFHGRIHIEEKDVQSLDRTAFVKFANEIIDVSFFSPRQGDSIRQIGKTLSGVPQLGTAAQLAGAAAAYVVRMILLKQPMPSGRYVLNPEEAFAKPL